MSMLTRQLRRILAAAAMALLTISPALAQDMVTVPTGSTVTVLKYNICRRVGNSTGSSILVPLGNTAEWIGTHSFTVNAPDFPGVSVTRCMPSGGDDARMCITHATGDSGVNDMCGGSMTWRVQKQSSILPIATDSDLSEWSAAITWATNNLGAPASARPDNILPACYRDSAMDELGSSPASPYYIPPDSDFCILRFYQPNVPQNSSSGPEWTGSSTVLYRIWRP